MLQLLITSYYKLLVAFPLLFRKKRPHNYDSLIFMETPQQKPTEPAVEKKKLNKKFIVGLTVMILAGGAYGVSKYIHSRHHEETDDAQVEANIAPVIPRVAGYIDQVMVSDNQGVKKGDTLLILDSRDLQLRLVQAEAALSAAKSNLGVAQATTTAAVAGITSAQANVGTATAQVEAAKVRVWRATQDYNRYASLIKDHSITQQQFEQAQAEKETAERQLQVLKEQANAAATQTSAVASQSKATGQQVNVAEANIRLREADVEAAKLNLSYTIITAPANGIVSKISLQPGQLLQQGQSLFNIVVDKNVWVIANFKETQLAKMQEGQKVEITIDALRGGPLEGKISSFSPATGARFSLLPPDNATGNFVKVVQRLPVKIEFDAPNEARLKDLRAGMNATVDVYIN